MDAGGAERQRADAAVEVRGGARDHARRRSYGVDLLSFDEAELDVTWATLLELLAVE